MDIRQLMIGDWVYNKHHGKNIRLTPYDFFTHTHNDIGEQALAPSAQPTFGRDLEPIPLTDEILEKNGFVCKGAWCLEGEDMGLKQIGDSWALLPYYYDYDSFRFTIISYIHELQHALKLCGIEKNIIL